MVCIYKNGLDFINDNQDILNSDPINLAFYVIDARMINSFDKNGFISKCYDENRYLLVLYLNPMNLMLYGDCSLCNEVCLVLNKYGFDFNGVLAESNLGECFLLEYERLFGGRHKIHLSMSIMKCNYVNKCDCSDVEFSKENDLFEIYGLFKMFHKEALGDDVDWESFKSKFNCRNYCLIRKNDRIVSIAKRRDVDNISSISFVYTLSLFRGFGFAKRIVSKLTMDILNEGKLPYLYVDNNNLISNHLYKSIGYVYDNPQTEFYYFK